LVRRFARTFADAEVIVTPSGSCAATVIDQHAGLAALAEDERRSRDVADSVGRVHEFSSFLVDVLDVEDVGAYFPHRVTYHATCHSLRLLRVGEVPLRLLRAVRDLELVELPEASTCCGFGGTFAVRNPDVSTAIVSDQLQHVLRTEAVVRTALDNSCLMLIGGGLQRLRAGVRTLHVAEILASEAA
jgi:L-lactate dehydrogenase complex protein LldE